MRTTVADTRMRCCQSLVCPVAKDCYAATWHQCGGAMLGCDRKGAPKDMAKNAMCVVEGDELQP